MPYLNPSETAPTNRSERHEEGPRRAIAAPAVSAPACLTQIGLIDLVADSVEAYVVTADDIGT